MLSAFFLWSGIALMPLKASGQQATLWNSDYFDVSYNTDGGYIQIYILSYIDDDDSHHGFIDNGDQSGPGEVSSLLYSVDGRNYKVLATFSHEGEDWNPMKIVFKDTRGQRVEAKAATPVHFVRDTIKWYVGNTNKDVRSVKLHIDKWNRKGNGGGTGDDQLNINEIRNITIPQLGGLKPVHTFLENDSVRLEWSMDSNELTPYSSVRINTNHTTLFQEGTVSWVNGVASSSARLPQSDTAWDYYFHAYVYDRFGDWYIDTTYTIPGITHPDSIRAEYNKETSKMDITWTIPRPVGDQVVTSPFKLQRALKPDFSDATDIDLALFPDLKYNRDSTAYTYADDPHAEAYYRIDRDFNEDWGWSKAKSVHVTAKHAAITAASHLTLSLDDGSGHAVLNWDTTGVWTEGAAFILTRINKTDGTSTDISLGKKDYYKGEYIDSLVRPCNEYYYRLQVKPAANLGFETEDPYQTTNTVLPVRIGAISDLSVSKGYFPDRVELSWKADGGFDYYVVKRKEYGSADSYIQVASMPATGSAESSLDDAKAMPGIYYDYLVMGAVSCNNTIRYSDTLHAIGFRSPTGSLNGRVAYENGQPVTNVSIRLQNEDNTALGESIYLNGNADSYLKIAPLLAPFADSALTFEAWIKPDDPMPKNQVIFSRDGQYELGFNGSGRLYFTYNGVTLTGPYDNKDGTFIHVAGIHHRDTLMIMLNDSLIAHTVVSFSPSSDADTAVFIGRNAAGNNFTGFIDEVSVWNRSLTPTEIGRDYTRLLAGDERGLTAYWRFDETIVDQFYDLSHEGDHYHRNDGVMNPDQVIRRRDIPTPGQLSLKAYTDTTGNYEITGIPYTGSNGTVYSIVPLLGTHQFDPVEVKRTISAASSSYVVDFTDKSAFQLEGHIYYRNSTVPVEGVQFQIDGKYALEGNGDLIQTGADGKFKLSVPVGTHKVQAVKNSHVFVNAGKITDRLGKDLNYQGPVSERILYDSTTIRFAGRVAGGPEQEAYPLGHSLSRNNLGKTLSITLTLPTQGKYELSTADSTVRKDHLLPSGEGGDSSHIHHTRISWQPDQIVIYPDSATGEFVADLIPVVFNVQKVEATGWGNLLEGGNAVQLDLSNRFIKDSSVYNYEDSAQSADGSWTHTAYSDTVFYNYAYKFIKRQTPQVSLAQLDNGGNEKNYFGDSLYHSQSLTGGAIEIPLLKPAGKNADRYLFNGHPVFSQAVMYHFRIRSFEEYPFYERQDADGTKHIAQQDGKDVIDRVPTQDGSVNIQNELREGAVEADTLSLDSSGTAYYDFVAGEPATAPGDQGLKHFSFVVRFGEATDVSWAWFGDESGMQAIVTGSKQTGTDFVTAGPNRMLMILRDPPGNQSYSFAEQGSTITSSTTYSGSVDNVSDVELLTLLGQKVVTFAGVGAGFISENQTDNNAGASVHVEEHYTHTDTKASATTLITRFQTSDASTFVGAPADLFVGYSTNITYGQSDNLVIIPKTEQRAGDSVIFDPGNNYLLVEKTGISLGEQFGTLFAYPQQHIETVLIPNLKKVRNSILLPASTTDAAAQAAANAQNQEIYVSRLSPDDENFGRSNNDPVFGGSAEPAFGGGPSYKIFFPQHPALAYTNDTIMTINQYIAQWTDVLKDNEKQKLESEKIDNISFHAGNTITRSVTTSSSQTKSNSFNIIVSGSLILNSGLAINGFGLKVSATTSLGTTEGGSIDQTRDSTSTIGFQLAAGGVGEYISLDVNKTKDGTLAFRTKGGETECPYEGVDTTKYYNPGTIIGQPTAQMDKPEITVDNPVVNNVPATKSAAYTIHLINASEAAWSTDFVLGYGSTDSVRGANISVDGVSIAAGRSYPVIYGEPVTKVLTLTKGPDAMDYNNIPIILHSACQYDPTGYQATIADTVFISAHFVPSCSNVNIKSPAGNWVLNTLSPVNSGGKRYLPVTLDQFDESNSLFDHIELQYKPAAASQWVTAMQFFPDSTSDSYREAQGAKSVITNPEEINYDLVMDDALFSDQRYDVRALAVCRLGPGNLINTPSQVVSGVKDTYYPRLFGSPEPGNGILGAGDAIKLNFNEPIAAGLLTPTDFQVTGIRNGAQGDHSVAVSLDGQHDYIRTEFEKNLSGRDLTAEMWVLPDASGKGTLLSHGDANTSLELSLTEGHYLQVFLGGKKITSDQPVDYRPGEWAHVAMVYHAADSSLSAYYNFREVIHGVTAGSYNGTGPFEIGRSISTAGDYFAGKLHGLRIWTKVLPATTLQTGSLKQLSGAEDGLMAFYPMTEGKGTVIFDKAHGNNATLTGQWTTPPGKAEKLNGDGYVKLSAGTVPVDTTMDYTLELWFKGDAGQAEAALASNGRGDGTDPGGSKKLFFLGFEKGKLTFENNGFKMQADGNYLDNHWHQVSLSVNRNSGVAQLYVDGQLAKYADARNLGGIAAPYIYLGARGAYSDPDGSTPHFDRYFTGSVDEFRLWNTYMGQPLITKNSNVRLEGDEVGLMAYYPFETYFDFQNNKEMGFTLADQKKQEDDNVHVPDAVASHASESDDMAPIKDHGPVENLQFDYVVNDDALIINLEEPRQAVDKTIVTFRVKNARDQNGNTLVSPVTWTAYIDQNPLKWGDDELNLKKDVDTALQFTSYISNNGGNIQHFVLDNLPGWLTAEPAEGTVGPEGRQQIVFKVADGLNIGAYNDIVYMRNDNGETESLVVNLKVTGQEPDWKVDPGDFKFNMNLYGKIRINGIFSVDEGDMLAAFINGKCIGVTHNTYFKDNDLWYAFLTLYGNSAKQEGIEFRLWDASTGKTYLGIPSSAVSFSNNSIVGTARDPVIFDGKEMLFRNIGLDKGWNWISFGLVNPQLSIVKSTLVNGSWQPGDIVKHDERGFDQYSSTAGWVGSLPQFDNTSLFKLKASTAQSFSIYGTVPDLKKIPITVRGSRWNYISYLPPVNMTVKEALADYDAADGDVLKSLTGFAMYDSRNGWVGNLSFLEPGKGYMLYRTAKSEATFFYPATAGSLDMPATETIELNRLETPVDNNYAFSDNMTVIAGVEGDITLQPGDRIAAYEDGELMGEARAVQNNVLQAPSFFFNISGSERRDISFGVLRNGTRIAISSTVIPYMSNSRIGLLGSPLKLQFRKTDPLVISSHVKIYPNPFSSRVSIEVSFGNDNGGKAHRISLDIYDLTGHLVWRQSEKEIGDGYYKTYWNGINEAGSECASGVYLIRLMIDGVAETHKVIKAEHIH
ncbi:hypothetical protein GCM10023143_11750 [Compostibacter hankyongensis]|uniref:LamG-like jellyroll fold domain-containing protein n=1 Tax=Compostibacter hankyongensis TaxID=1007089 RepID=A0ABP8FKP7_9BACT